jgi:hypothetical protein
MKRILVAVFATLALALGFGGSASAASPQASCQGLATSSLAGQPGAHAQERLDLLVEAAANDTTAGAITSNFAHLHLGSVPVCLPPEE